MNNIDYKALVENSSDWIWELDHNGEFTYVSPQVEAILGYKPVEMIGKHCTTFMPPSDQDMYLFRTEYLSKLEPFSKIQHHYLHKNGTIVTLESNGVPFFDDKGTLLGYRGSDRDISSRVNKEQQLEMAQKIAHLGSWELNLLDQTQEWSDEVFALLGEAPQSFDPTFENFMSFLSNKDKFRVKDGMQRAFEGIQAYDLLHDVIRRDGSVRHVHSRAKLIFNGQGEPIKMLGTVLDVTRQTQLEHSLQNTLQTLQGVIDNMNNLVFYKDVNYNYLGCNNAFANFIGHPKESIVGQNDFDFFSTEVAEHFRALDEKVIEEEETLINPQWVTYPNGEEIFLHTTTAPFYDIHGTIIGLVGNSVDLTKEKHLSDSLTQQAQYDYLTNIPNRALFMDRLDQAIASAQRHHTEIALFFMDLDGFKAINDTYGHHYGDLVLQYVSQLLLGSIRKTDTLARLGGDEFAIIITDVKEKESIFKLAKLFIETVAQPIKIENYSFQVTLSIGISFCPKGTHTADTLLKYADDAMYEAKAQGKNRYVSAQQNSGI